MVRSATTVGVTLFTLRAARKAASSWETISRTPSTSAPPGAWPSSAARVSRAIRRTPGSSATAGSTSRGRARSTMASGRSEVRREETASTSTTHAGRARAGDEHVHRSHGTGAELVERDRPGGVLLGQAGGALRGAVGHDDRAGSGARRDGHGQAGHRAGTDDDDVLAGEVAHVVGGPGERGLDQARRDPVDVGLGVRALAHAQGLLEQRVQRRADGGGVLADAQRLAGLAEDLALAEHHRVEAGRDVEEVGDGAVVVVHVEVLEHVVGAGRRRARRSGARSSRRCRGSARRRRRPRCGCRWTAPSPR